ncbi:MAG: carboxypeptidase-like regulatory domain-containing protein [Deltaproteobacteria bacterium]
MTIIRSIVVCTILFSAMQLYGQYANKDVFAIQFSGVVVTQDEKTGDAIPLPYTNIWVKGSSRGTISAFDGFFSIVALRGDTIRFSYVGYDPVEFIIPDTLTVHFYSVYQIMTQNDVLLPETVIYPWPRKEFFKQELLAMDISNELKKQAEQNLAEKIVKEMIKEVPFDGMESVNLQLNKLADDAVYTGQYKPMRIFDIMAWQKFIKAWKRGDFKRKKNN